MEPLKWNPEKNGKPNLIKTQFIRQAFWLIEYVYENEKKMNLEIKWIL